jgi:hypothetical protein
MRKPFVAHVACNVMTSSEVAGVQLLALSLEGCLGNLPTEDL